MFEPRSAPKPDDAKPKIPGVGAHKPAQTDSDRRWAGFGEFRPRSKTFKLRDTGQSLRGLEFIMYLAYVLAVGSKNTKSAHERALELVSGADVWCNLHSFSSRGSRGPPRAQRGRKSAKNPGPDLSCYRRVLRGTSQIEEVLRKTSQRVRVPAKGPANFWESDRNRRV